MSMSQSTPSNSPMASPILYPPSSTVSSVMHLPGIGLSPSVSPQSFTPVTCGTPFNAPHSGYGVNPGGLSGRLFSGSPQRNIVFQWSSPSSRQKMSDASVEGRHLSSEYSPRRSPSRPLNKSIQTSIQTTTTANNASHIDGAPVMSQDCPERNALFNQLTAQLEQVHQMFRDGLLEAKEYHQRVAELMVQLHTCHPPPTAAILSPPGFTTQMTQDEFAPQGHRVVLLPTGEVQSPVFLHPRLVSGTNLILGQNNVVTTMGQTPVSGSVFGQSPVILPRMERTIIADGRPITTTTTTTTTQRRSSNASQDNDDHVPLMTVALSPSDILLLLKLLERENSPITNNQITALMYSVVADAGLALEHQLKSSLNSTALSPEIKSILTSTTVSSNAASELAGFANTIYKVLKRSEIKGLKTKHNRLRLLATEASSRRWKGRELLEFIASLLQSFESDLNSRERLTVIAALVEKLRRRAGTTESLGELYKAFDVIFPGCDEDANMRMSLNREGSRALVFSNEFCHACKCELLGFRFRCTECHSASLTRGVTVIGPRSKTSAAHQHKMEFVLCANCFVESCRMPGLSGALNERSASFENSPQNVIRHCDPTTCSRKFLCEIPLSVLSPNCRYYRPLRHMSLAPPHGWTSTGAAAVMDEGKMAHRLRQRSAATSPATLPKTDDSSKPLGRFTHLSAEIPNGETTVSMDGSVRTVTRMETETFTHTNRWEAPDATDPRNTVQVSTLISEQTTSGTGRVPDSRSVNTYTLEDSSGNVNTYSVAAMNRNVELPLERVDSAGSTSTGLAGTVSNVKDASPHPSDSFDVSSKISAQHSREFDFADDSAVSAKIESSPRFGSSNDYETSPEHSANQMEVNQMDKMGQVEVSSDDPVLQKQLTSDDQMTYREPQMRSTCDRIEIANESLGDLSSSSDGPLSNSDVDSMDDREVIASNSLDSMSEVDGDEKELELRHRQVNPPRWEENEDPMDESQDGLVKMSHSVTPDSDFEGSDNEKHESDEFKNRRSTETSIATKEFHNMKSKDSSNSISTDAIGKNWPQLANYSTVLSAQLSRELSAESRTGSRFPFNSRPNVSSAPQDVNSPGGFISKNVLTHNASNSSLSPTLRQEGSFVRQSKTSTTGPRSFSGSASPNSDVWGSGAVTHRLSERLNSNVNGSSGFSTARPASKSVLSPKSWSTGVSGDDVSMKRTVASPQRSSKLQTIAGRLSGVSVKSGNSSLDVTQQRVTAAGGGTGSVAPRGFAASLPGRRSRAFNESAKHGSGSMRFR